MSQQSQDFSGDLATDLYRGVRTGTRAGDELSAFLRFLRDFILMVLGIACRVPEALLHIEFGERYLGIVPITLATVGLMVLATWFDSTVGWVLCSLFVVACMLHRVQAVRRLQQARRWHSRSPGYPWAFAFGLLPKKSLARWQLLGEPAMLTLLGGLLYPTGDPYALVTAGFGIVLLVRNVAEALRQRDVIFDLFDQQIEAQHRAEVLQGKTDPRQSDGYTVPGTGVASKAVRATLKEAFDNLDPALQSIIEPKRASGDPSADTGSKSGTSSTETALSRHGDHDPSITTTDEGTDLHPRRS